MTEKIYPVRKCVSCGQHKLKNQLVRIAKSNGEAVLDDTGKMPGRGCYLCASKDCINAAKKARRIERALKIAVNEKLFDRLSALTEEK